MKHYQQACLADVQQIYSGAQGDLWELFMGQQVHIGGLASSMELSQRAGIAKASRGIDLCCCTGAGMRFLVRFCGVAGMHGVDATARVVELGRHRSSLEKMENQIAFTIADACDSNLSAGQADFVWSEDAWCYVADKPKLLSEAARLVRKGGVIAFTDWVEGENLDDGQAERFMKFMKFPSMFSIEDYKQALADCGCEVLHAYDTGRFEPCARLYIDMAEKQLTYDALRILGYDTNILAGLAGELKFAHELAQAGRIAQGLLVARKI
jgi:SAM-dependent methyltransferase